jgi:hypothetical protein
MTVLVYPESGPTSLERCLLPDPEMLPFLDGLDGIGDLQHGGHRQRKRRDG